LALSATLYRKGAGKSEHRAIPAMRICEKCLNAAWHARFPAKRMQFARLLLNSLHETYLEMI
jgi:hypothetical protein